MHERVEWSIPGSMHMDAYDALKANDPKALANVELPCDIPVVTVCAAGKTSLVAAQQLQARGIQALSLEGGMKAWSLAWNSAEVPVPGGLVRVLQVRRTGKGCLSYLIGAGDEAIVIDASLDSQVYLDLATPHGWQITSVFDTHIHADHLSRSRQLAERSGAMLFLPDQQRVSFPFTTMRDGDTLATPTMLLTALYTPGHTMESTCYLLNKYLLFTGDTLFPTGIGRPDLEADEQQATPPCFRALPQSAQTPRSPLRRASACLDIPAPRYHLMVIPIAATLAQIDDEVGIIHATREAFIEQIMMRLPPTPPNYRRVVTFNEMGLLPESGVTDLEAGANRCAIS